MLSCRLQWMLVGVCLAVPQAELSVAGGIGVPVGQRLHPPLQPRALDDEVGDGGLRHDCGCVRAGNGSRKSCSSSGVVKVGSKSRKSPAKRRR